MNQRPAATSIRGAVLLALGCTLALAVTLPSTVAGSDSGWQVQLCPDSDLCPRYLTDPRLPVFGLKALSFSDSEVPDAGDARFGIQIGGRFSVLRLHPTGQPDRGVQFDVDVGFTGQFLSLNSQPMKVMKQLAKLRPKAEVEGQSLFHYLLYPQCYS